jgi:hypothetical protein
VTAAHARRVRTATPAEPDALSETAVADVMACWCVCTTLGSRDTHPSMAARTALVPPVSGNALRAYHSSASASPGPQSSARRPEAHCVGQPISASRADGRRAALGIAVARTDSEPSSNGTAVVQHGIWARWFTGYGATTVSHWERVSNARVSLPRVDGGHRIERRSGGQHTAAAVRRCD